jgi:hypothetical protein
LLATAITIGGVQQLQPAAADTQAPSADGGSSWLTWTEPVNVSRSPKTDPLADWPTLGVGAGGQVVYLAWSDDRGTSSNIYYAASANRGLSWATPQSVKVTNRDSLRPNIIVLDSNPYVAWADETADTLHHKTYEKALGAGALAAVPNDQDVLALAPRLGRAPEGGLHMVLHGGDNNQTDILYSHRDAGTTTWAATSLVYPHEAVGSSDPALAVSPNGSVLHVVWQEKFSTTESKILYRRGQLGKNGVTWGSRQSLSNGIPLSVRPAIALANGMVHVVWGEVAADGQYVRYRYGDGQGNWSPSKVRVDREPVHLNSLLPTELSPSVVVAPSGGVCVAWNGYRIKANQAEEIYVSCTTDLGVVWSAPVNVSRSPEAPSVRPVLAVGSDGVLHAAWRERVGSGGVNNCEIYYARSFPFSVMLPLINR